MNCYRSFSFFALAFASIVPFAQAQAYPVALTSAELLQQTGAQSEDVAYTAGTRALNDSRWSDAVNSFEQVANAKGKKADAGLYWKAYALSKLGKQDLAGATCAQLKSQYASSQWNRDCSALNVAERAASRQLAEAERESSRSREREDRSDSKDPDADIKILALNSLLHRDPAQAVPLLRGILTGDQPASVKKHALFVLAQNKSPEADALLHDLMVGKMGADLQRDSIQSAGMYRGRAPGDTLVEVYRTTQDAKIKRSILSALFIANDDQHLVELARSEKDLSVKREIVSQLAVMKGQAASDYMLELLK
jgi:hypothetical protein